MSKFDFIIVLIFFGVIFMLHENTIVAHAEDTTLLPSRIISIMPPDNQWTEITDIESKADILDLIYHSAQANYDKIKTWEAKYKVKGHNYWPEAQNINKEFSIATKHEDTVTFSLDAQNNKLNWRFVTNEYWKYYSNRSEWIKHEPIYGINFNNIYVPNQTLELPELCNASGETREIKNYRMHSKLVHDKYGMYPRSPFSQKSDPRFFYCPINPDKEHTFWYFYRRAAEILRGNDEKKKKSYNQEYLIFQYVNGNDILHKVEVWLPSKTKCKTSAMFYSGKSEFNPVEGIAWFCNGDVISHKQWAWQEQDRIFIPSNFISNNTKDTGQMEYSLIESKLNTKIPEDKFTYKGLGLSEGDLIFDDVVKMVYIIDKKGNKKQFCPYGGEIIKSKSYQTPTVNIIAIAIGILLMFIGIIAKIIVQTQKIFSAKPIDK
jgi:hypothetical protein